MHRDPTRPVLPLASPEILHGPRAIQAPRRAQDLRRRRSLHVRRRKARRLRQAEGPGWEVHHGASDAPRLHVQLPSHAAPHRPRHPAALDQGLRHCEYGAFDGAHRVLPRTRYDVRIDEHSPRPGQQAFEKLAAGLYLGEIFRLVVLELAERGLVFGSSRAEGRERIAQSYVLDTGFLSRIEDDESEGLRDIRSAFRDVLGLEAGDEDVEVARRVAEMVAVRGARLCACGIAAICRLEGIEMGHVAADGSVANKHPRFKKRWAKALGEILGWEKKDGIEDPIIITSAEDGSGVGCAIIAAMELERRGRAP